MLRFIVCLSLLCQCSSTLCNLCSPNHIHPIKNKGGIEHLQVCDRGNVMSGSVFRMFSEDDLIAETGKLSHHFYFHRVLLQH